MGVVFLFGISADTLVRDDCRSASNLAWAFRVRDVRF